MIFSLYRDKENVVDQEEEDSVEYSLKQIWHFNPEKSAMSENVDIYSFHPIILSLILIAQRERPSAIGIISKYNIRGSVTNRIYLYVFKS